MRKTLINLGISQISAGSTVEVGGYTSKESGGTQFSVTDDRDAMEIIEWVMDEGFIPSFCTACYRSGRTGDRFMQLAKSGNIKNVCHPNALMTLVEYSEDYGSEEFKDKTEKLIENELNKIENLEIREYTIDSINKIRQGKRDFFV